MRSQEIKVPLPFFAVLAIFLITMLGGLLGYVVGAPKAFVLIALMMVVWLVAGWFFGGWRAVLAGLSALAGALTASEGTYALSFVFLCAALLLVFVDISPRGASGQIHSKGI
jgi:hypothetical protein